MSHVIPSPSALRYLAACLNQQLKGEGRKHITSIAGHHNSCPASCRWYSTPPYGGRPAAGPYTHRQPAASNENRQPAPPYNGRPPIDSFANRRGPPPYENRQNAPPYNPARQSYPPYDSNRRAPAPYGSRPPANPFGNRQPLHPFGDRQPESPPSSTQDIAPRAAERPSLNDSASTRRRADTRDVIYKEFTLDNDIPTQFVQVKDHETQKLEDPRSKAMVLRDIDRETHCIRMLARRSDDEPAIVEITTKAALMERLKIAAQHAKDAAKAQRENKPKQIELNWAIGGHDLELKMKQLKAFLEKGKKVEILLAAKKRQRKAAPEEAELVVKEIKRHIREMDGIREVKDLEGKIGGQAVMTVQKSKN